MGRCKKVYCAHCGKHRWLQARGLCRPCHIQPAVRKLYARVKETWKPSVVLAPVRRPRPTGAAPGTVEKVLELADRASKGQALRHPDDAGSEGGGTPVRELDREAYLCLMSWTNVDGSQGCSLSPSQAREVGGGARKRRGATAGVA